MPPRPCAELPIVCAEVGAYFPDVGDMRRALPGTRIRFDPFVELCADLAARQCREYRRRGGRRTRLIADFCLGANAQAPRPGAPHPG